MSHFSLPNLPEVMGCLRDGKLTGCEDEKEALCETFSTLYSKIENQNLKKRFQSSVMSVQTVLKASIDRNNLLIFMHSRTE